MAGSFTSTGSYSNLTRLELEQLRKADFFSGSKALTVGDSALPPEGVVGKGDVNAEPYFTAPSILLDDAYTNTPPTQPGPGVGTIVTTSDVVSEIARWFGPIHLRTGSTLTATGASSISDTNATFTSGPAVLAGDILLIKSGSALNSNQNAVATVVTVAATTLTLSNINNTFTGNGSSLVFDSDTYSYVIVRPSAVQLFAVPGSGPTGQEQTFLTVIRGSTLHNTVSPTIDAINADRVKSVVPPNYNLNSTVDRADAVYGAPVVRTSLDKLGYRIVLYPDNGSNAPDLTNPIATLNPVINPAIPPTDSRMTFDYKAGVVRFSDAPAIGGTVKVAGGTNPTTGRLNLYAVFWAVDTSLTKGNARGLWASRNTVSSPLHAGKVFFDAANNVWRMGSTTSSNEFVAMAQDNSEEAASPTRFGSWDALASGTFKFRGFVYHSGTNVMKMFTQPVPMTGDALTVAEVSVGEKVDISVGDITSPPWNPGGDFNATTSYGGTNKTARQAFNAVATAIGAAATGNSQYSRVRLHSGRYYADQTIVIPPFTEVDGDGEGTKIIVRNLNGTTSFNSVFKFGTNTKWGVYDFFVPGRGENQTPTPVQTTLPTTSDLEGMACIWNHVRRVWAYAHADSATGGVYLQEVSPAGVATFAGRGVLVNTDANPLFTYRTTNSHNHTPNHYPRIAYHEHTDQYSIVWVESYVNVVVGPRVFFTVVGVNNPLTTPTLNVILGPTEVQRVNGPLAFSDHPSIAVDNSNTTSSYPIFITSWNFAMTSASPGGTVTTSEWARVFYTSSGFVNSTFSNNGTGAVISSTDIKEDEQGGYCAVASIRYGQIFISATGSLTGSVVSDTFGSGGTFATYGVGVGWKFCYLGPQGNTEAGQDGYIWQATSSTQMNVTSEDFGVVAGSYTNVGSGLIYAFVPPSYIASVRYYAGAQVGDGSATKIIDGLPSQSAGTYNLDQREPDYVRLAKGGSNWLLAYQAMNTTGWMSQPTIANFDNSKNLFATNPNGFVDGLITMESTELWREHISTCAVVLGDAGQIAYPTGNNSVGTTLRTLDSSSGVGTAGSAFDQIVTRDRELSLRSLGSREPITRRPNYYVQSGGSRIPYARDREVSALNFHHRWVPNPPQVFQGTEYLPSLIPDVTWDGTDWVVVSPSKNKIHSKIGTYFGDPSGNTYLSDGAFYFGNEAPGKTAAGVTIDGNWLKKTVSTHNGDGQGDLIYFPAAGLFVEIKDVHSEHTVILMSDILALGNTKTVNHEWVLIRPFTVGLTAGIKTPGFRVSYDGRQIISSTFTTFADDAPELEVQPAGVGFQGRVSTVRRPNTDGGNLPGTVASDFPDEDSRLSADLAFKGVCVGAPKGTNNLALTEAPMVAIAWGPKGYGAVQRHNASGSTLGTATSALEFYYQSFGPFASSLKRMHIVGNVDRTPYTSSSYFGLGKTLRLLSSKRVFSRAITFGTSGTDGEFATDGYRNVFPYAGTASGVSFSATTVNGTMVGVYTDAIGANPIRKQGMSIVSSANLFQPDFADQVTNTSANDQRFNPMQTAPKAVWDGQRFVYFWLESPQNPGGAGNNPKPSFLCAGVFPGDDDRALPSLEVLNPGDTAISQLPMEVARISCGVNNGVQAFAFDVAFSGTTFAALWTGGMDPTLPTGGSIQGSSAVGVAFFDLSMFTGNGATSPGGATNYGISTLPSAQLNVYSHPKIIWDGKQFVGVWRNGSTPTSNGSVAQIVIPEQGLARPTQYKAFATVIGEPTGGSGIASSASQTTPGVSSIFLQLSFSMANGWGAIQPGDWFVITYATNGGTNHPEACGAYLIQDYDPNNQKLYLAYTGAVTFPALTLIYGYVRSGGIGDYNLIPSLSTSEPGGAMTYAPPNVLDFHWATPNSSGDAIDRIQGLAYNEAADEYAVLMTLGQGGTHVDNAIVVSSFKRGVSKLTPYTKIFSSLQQAARISAIAWNGKNYLVVYTEYTFGTNANGLTNPDEIRYCLLSPTLGIEEDGVLVDFDAPIGQSPNFIGNGPGQSPGPGFDLGGSGTGALSVVKAHPRNISVKWNARLNRWVVAVAATWVDGTNLVLGGTVGTRLGAVLLPVYPMATAGNWTFTNIVGNHGGGTITISSFVAGSAGFVPPGAKLMINTGATTVAHLTVLRQLTSSTILVDGFPSEVTAVNSATQNLYCGYREDVFCFTLGYPNPLVKVHDADDVTIEDVTFSGGSADVEESFRRMSRPMWTSGGPHAGETATSTSYLRQHPHSLFQHLHPTPTNKVSMPRYVNVRSTTKARYGSGAPDGFPKFDRYLNDGRNRRG